MRETPAFLELEQIVLENNYTVEQVQAVTLRQAMKLLPGGKDLPLYFNGVKKHLIAALQERDRNTGFEDFKQTLIDAGIKTAYPDITFKRGFEQGKPFVTIWPKGEPE